jgi:ACT domain-containing protein
MKSLDKKAIIEQLKKTPIIQVTCEKLGISRATFYRWKKKDEKFAEEVDLALQEGSQLINDMAESQLITAIKNGNLTGIIFWLKNHHKNYSPKLEVTTKNPDIPLTDEQREIIRQSLNMAFSLNLEDTQDGTKDTKSEQ